MNKKIIFIFYAAILSTLAQMSLMFEVDGLQFTHEAIGEGLMVALYHR